MRVVNRDPPAAPARRKPATRERRGEARRPKVRVVEFETNAVGGIHDEDWNWRLLRRAPASGAATTAATANAKTTRFDGAGGEDLGAAVPRSVRGLEAKIDKGENEGVASETRRAGVLEVCVRSGDRRRDGRRGRGERNSRGRKGEEKGKEREGRVTSAPAEEALPPPPPVMDFASLTKGLAPKRAAPAEDGTSGGESTSSPGRVAETATVARRRRRGGAKKKKKKKKKPADGEADGATESSKPMSAVDRAMAMLMGG